MERMSGGGATLSDNNVLGAPEWRQTGQPQHVQQVKTAPPKAVPRPRSKENDVDTLSRRMTAKLKIGGGGGVGGGGGGDRHNRRGDLRGDLRAELQAKRQNEGRGRENNNNNNTQRGAGGGGKEQHAPRPHDDKQQQQRSKPPKGNKNGRNTQNFAPSTEPPSLKVIFGDARKETLGRRLHGRNVVYVPNFFCDEDDVAVYDNLMREVKAGGSPDMWVPWHENSHFIANDRDRHGKWKSESPIFCAVVDRIAKYFNMNVKVGTSGVVVDTRKKCVDTTYTQLRTQLTHSGLKRKNTWLQPY